MRRRVRLLLLQQFRHRHRLIETSSFRGWKNCRRRWEAEWALVGNSDGGGGKEGENVVVAAAAAATKEVVLVGIVNDGGGGESARFGHIAGWAGTEPRTFTSEMGGKDNYLAA